MLLRGPANRAAHAREGVVSRPFPALRYSRAEGESPESQCASQWFQVQDADAPEFAAREFCVTKMVNINENFTRVAEARAAMNASRN